MSALLPLRDYQLDTIKQLHTRWDAGDTRVPAVLATGLGKTVIFAHLIADWLRVNVRKRAIVLVHTDELVQQAYKKMRDVAPDLTIGIVKAERNEVYARAIIASVQSLRSAKRRAQIRNLGLLIIDECHHSTSPTYRAILEHFGATPSPCSECQGTGAGDANGKCWDCQGTALYNGGQLSDIKVAGFTATLARGDKAKLSDIWSEPAVTYGISFGIRRGYLLDVRGKRIVVPDLDFGKVKKQGGDYQDASLGQAMADSYAPEIIAAKYKELASDRKGLVFWPLVATAELGAKAFNDAGIPSAVIHGTLGREERRLLLKKLASGEIQCIHNCAVLTEGFDDPTISCVVIARPTRSAPLYQQMVGRGLRPDLSLPPDRRGDCLVLDVVGASRTHDLRSLVDLSEKELSEDVVAMDEELSLLDMEEFEDKEEGTGQGGWPEEEPYVGATLAEDFDPLGRTTAGAWLKTFQGHYFLPIGRKAYVLLVPSEDPGRWDVAWIPKESRHFGYLGCTLSYSHKFGYSRTCSCGQGHTGYPGALTEHKGLSLDMACSWAEEVMEKVGGAHAIRTGHAKQAWREQPANITLLREAWDLHIPTKGLNKGELQDAVDILTASGRIDPVVAFMLSAREGQE